MNFDGKCRCGTPFSAPVSNSVQIYAITADMAKNVIFNMAAAAILNLLQVSIFVIYSSLGGGCGCSSLGESVSFNVYIVRIRPPVSAVGDDKKKKKAVLSQRCMGALKIFRSPCMTSWLRPRLLFPNFLMGFCSDWAYKWTSQIEVRSFTVPELIGGTRKKWAVPGYTHAQ